MKPLGDIVSALRTENGWTLQELAANIRRQGATNVKHQHLQQLESKPYTSPRYIVELAGAFGKSVEELRTWERGLPYYGPHDLQSAHVRDAAVGNYVVAAQLTDIEKRLLADYRACPPNVQNGVRALLRACRKMQ